MRRRIRIKDDDNDKGIRVCVVSIVDVLKYCTSNSVLTFSDHTVRHKNQAQHNH